MNVLGMPDCPSLYCVNSPRPMRERTLRYALPPSASTAFLITCSAFSSVAGGVAAGFSVSCASAGREVKEISKKREMASCLRVMLGNNLRFIKVTSWKKLDKWSGRESERASMKLYH